MRAGGYAAALRRPCGGRGPASLAAAPPRWCCIARRAGVVARPGWCEVAIRRPEALAARRRRPRLALGLLLLWMSGGVRLLGACAAWRAGGLGAPAARARCALDSCVDDWLASCKAPRVCMGVRQRQQFGRLCPWHECYSRAALQVAFARHWRCRRHGCVLAMPALPKDYLDDYKESLG